MAMRRFIAIRAVRMSQKMGFVTTETRASAAPKAPSYNQALVSLLFRPCFDVIRFCSRVAAGIWNGLTMALLMLVYAVDALMPERPESSGSKTE